MSSTARAFQTDESAQDALGPAERTAFANDAMRHALPRRVLLVDDNRDASSSLAELLRAMGHEVVVADDGPESLSLVEAGQTFDVALLDIGLPGMSGHELSQRLRKRFPQPMLRLVALTGYGIEPGAAAPQRNGFDDYFVKPVDIDALLASIDKASPPTT